jgi:hypothetical protein
MWRGVNLSSLQIVLLSKTDWGKPWKELMIVGLRTHNRIRNLHNIITIMNIWRTYAPRPASKYAIEISSLLTRYFTTEPIFTHCILLFPRLHCTALNCILTFTRRSLVRKIVARLRSPSSAEQFPEHYRRYERRAQARRRDSIALSSQYIMKQRLKLNWNVHWYSKVVMNGE